MDRSYSHTLLSWSTLSAQGMISPDVTMTSDLLQPQSSLTKHMEVSQDSQVTLKTGEQSKW